MLVVSKRHRSMHRIILQRFTKHGWVVIASGTGMGWLGIRVAEEAIPSVLYS